MFTDDTNLFFFSRKSVINILFENANDELEKISESFKANRLLLN